MPFVYFQNQQSTLSGNIQKIDIIKNKHIIAFAPHADDLSIGAGGFLATLAKQNDIVPVLAFTGWRGVLGLARKQEAIKLRETEMIKEAKALGIHHPLFLKLRLYEKDSQIATKKDLSLLQALLLKEEPDIIFIPNAKDIHPRHKQLTRLVLEALGVVRFKTLEIFYYEIPWSVFPADRFNFIVPLGRQELQKKIAGIKVHKSQLVRTDFVRLSKALLALRAGMVPEQKITGFGGQKTNLGSWLEVFQYKKIPA